MPFTDTDLYLASGTAQLKNTWVDPVYKFDSSGFYNWEQDNLPIYDLEDRDDLLFEQAGFPTSSVDGMMLTVSCCGIDNKKVFGTIADAVDALPHTIRFPVIIEVAASGELGELRLEDFQFEGSGAGIEIVNRGFAKVLTVSSASLDHSILTSVTTSSITEFSSIDLSTTMTDSSSLGVSDTVYSDSDAITYWDNFIRAFVTIPEWGRTESAPTNPTSNVNISTNFKDPGSGSFLGSVNKFSVSEYTDGASGDYIQIVNPSDGTVEQRNNPDVAEETGVTGFVYANALSRAVVSNCGGRVYIRGFCVDGVEGAAAPTDPNQVRSEYGFEIKNSDVVIENCTVTRCSLAGLHADNSKIILNRGFIAHHNYSPKASWSGIKPNVKTPGLKAINTSITLSSTDDDSLSNPKNSPFCFTRNKIGIDLINSVIKTPDKYKSNWTTTTNGDSATFNAGANVIILQSFLNIDEGIKCKNSTFDFLGRICSFQNNVGIKADNTTLNIADLTIEYNQNEGIVANNSHINYWSDGFGIVNNYGVFYPFLKFYKNGQHLVLNKSSFIPPDKTPTGAKVGTNFGVIGFHSNFGGVERDTYFDTFPSVVVDNGSFLYAIGAKAQSYDSDALGSSTSHYAFCKGSSYKVDNQSTLKLVGTKDSVTRVIGPYQSDFQQKVAGIYAGNQSKVSISGPTQIVQCGIDALAEDNSKIIFEPQMKNGFLDTDTYDLSDTGNHTNVLLHSTRACLVANNSSEITMKNIGDYYDKWASADRTDSDLATSNVNASGYPGANVEASYQKGGSIRFLPNPYADYTELNLESQAHPALTTNQTADDYDTTLFEYPSDNTGTKLASYGGFCVRATNQSHVKVQNVNFECAWDNTSGAYYDASATDCELLRIWNIADNSTLHASHISINGGHPRDVSGSYYGPSSVWVDGTTILSGAPSSTPDTSSLSVLDYYGIGADPGGIHTFYGQTEAQNVGPFRIYVSPDPKAKYLGYPVDIAGNGYNPYPTPTTFSSMGFEFNTAASVKTGIPYQLFAQGYSPSSDCSAVNITEASAIYKDLAFSAYITTLPAPEQVENVASSFYYPDQMLSDTSKNIWLDESAMNTFANAKNGLLETSRRKKIFSYYNSYTTNQGEASWNNTSGIGFGSANIFDTDRTY